MVQEAHKTQNRLREQAKNSVSSIESEKIKSQAVFEQLLATEKDEFPDLKEFKAVKTFFSWTKPSNAKFIDDYSVEYSVNNTQKYQTFYQEKMNQGWYVNMIKRKHEKSQSVNHQIIKLDIRFIKPF